MPIYEYECKACRTVFERFQRFSEPPVTECPDCRGPVRKVLHPVGIVFKGSGWYSTDARPAEGGSGNGSATGESAASDKAAGKASGESKPAAGNASSPPAPTSASS
jgi:putative FmdB family regulatory protein